MEESHQMRDRVLMVYSSKRPGVFTITQTSNAHSVNPSHAHSVNPSNAHSVNPANAHLVNPFGKPPSHLVNFLGCQFGKIWLTHLVNCSHPVKTSLAIGWYRVYGLSATINSLVMYEWGRHKLWLSSIVFQSDVTRANRGTSSGGFIGSRIPYAAIVISLMETDSS